MTRLVLGAALALFAAAPASARDTERKEDVLDDLSFRSIGPAVMGGRIDAVAVVEAEPWILYLGTASGGVWKSVNKGVTWKPVFDHQGTSSIGDVAVAPSDPAIVWVGTGEPNNRQSSSFGDGVYKSEDGGRSFTHTGLSETQHIGKVIVHPSDPNRVYVAALGGLWSANEERGVYRTRDGGKSWEKVLFVDEDTGVVTLAMDPSSANVLYAAAYQRRRTPWGFNGGGPGSGLYKSTDGGDSWRRLSEGLPEGPIGRIGISIFRKNPRIVYALIEHEDEGGLYRSLDRGESWERINSLNPRPMYYSKIFVDPADANRIYVLGSSFHVSDDGGESFEVNREMTPTYDVGVHGDHHALWIDPENSEHLILGGDGGLYFSWDRGRNWDKVNNVPIAQFYAIAVDMEEPYNIYGGAQDTHSWGGPSATRNQIGILNSDWFQINFGDGMYQQVDPTDANVVYTESQGGNLIRLDRRTGDRKAIKPYPEEEETRYRFHWTSPFLVSRHDPKVLYFGGNRLFISRDRGDTWTATSELTRNEDRDELPIMGEIPDESTLSRHDGVASWGTITTIAESPSSPDVVYVGTDDGRVQLTRDGGRTWESLEPNFEALDPKRTKVSRIVASHAQPERAYVSFDRHHLGDFAPYLYVTEDWGKSWRSIGGDLPRAGWINVVAEHPRNPELLFVGTETGLFASLDRGESWARMGGGFPTVPVDDLVIHPRDNDLVVGTHGRSIYILDDITALEQHRPGDGGLRIFDARKATIFMPWKHESYGAQRQFLGENPPYGALLTYYSGEPVEGGTHIEIRDAGGAVIRSLVGPGRRGLNRTSWDLRAEGPDGVQGGRGPLVPPGRYAVTVEAGGLQSETSVEVELDPRIDVTPAEFGERFDFLTRVNELRARLSKRISRAEALEEQIGHLTEVLVGEENEEIRGALRDLEQRIAEAREPIGGSGGPRFGNRSLERRASGLFDELGGDDVRQGTLHGPTPVQRRRLRRLEEEANEAIAALEKHFSESVPEIDRKLRETSLLRLEPGE